MHVYFVQQYALYIVQRVHHFMFSFIPTRIILHSQAARAATLSMLCLTVSASSRWYQHRYTPMHSFDSSRNIHSFDSFRNMAVWPLSDQASCRLASRPSSAHRHHVERKAPSEQQIAGSV